MTLQNRVSVRRSQIAFSGQKLGFSTTCFLEIHKDKM
jgi:hypothetical protein